MVEVYVLLSLASGFFLGLDSPFLDRGFVSGLTVSSVEVFLLLV